MSGTETESSSTLFFRVQLVLSFVFGALVTVVGLQILGLGRYVEGDVGVVVTIVGAVAGFGLFFAYLSYQSYRETA